VIRGCNDDEIPDFALRSATLGWHVRFIELMPVGGNDNWTGDPVVPVPEMRSRVEAALGPLVGVHGPTGNGPARYYHLAGAKARGGSVGFIGARSEHFCERCNRLRLTADGKLRPCLLSDYEIDLRGPLRSGASGDEVQEILAYAIRTKPARHLLAQALSPRDRTMAEIGG
jgi:GTP 3',8-cyclase